MKNIFTLIFWGVLLWLVFGATSGQQDTAVKYVVKFLETVVNMIVSIISAVF